jgi:hypothetical protein
MVLKLAKILTFASDREDFLDIAETTCLRRK